MTAIGTAFPFIFLLDSKHKALKEVATCFGDDDLLVVDQQNIHIDHEKAQVVAEIKEEAVAVKAASA